jgi:hypothetical protein
VLDKIQELKKALEAGNYNAAPGAMTQGSTRRSVQYHERSDVPR